MEMVLLIGCQGAGKSTFYKSRFFHTHVRVNLDMLKTRHRERVLIEACLVMQQKFVVDNTNPTSEERKKYINAAQKAGFRIIGYYFDAPIADLLSRNAKRPGKAKIPEVGVRATLNKLQAPVFSEGFSELYCVHNPNGGQFVVTRIEQ